MEGNKDEAERCIDYAQQAFNYGDRAKAERFLQKAERLYPTQKAKGMKLSILFQSYLPKRDFNLMLWQTCLTC